MAINRHRPERTQLHLVEDVERLDRLELVLLVHVVLRHDLLELGARHVHRRPSRVRGELHEMTSLS